MDLDVDGPVAAAQIAQANWRQCSVFRPNNAMMSHLPAHLDLKADEWLVVCTQSCSLCGGNFEKEPMVEVMVGEPITRYNFKHSEAQGKNSHTFQLPVNGLYQTPALVCRMARRAFFPRILLRGASPQPCWVELSALDSFKGWLANYYTRIALPDEMVLRLRAPGGIKERITETLNKIVPDLGQQAYIGVKSFFITWSPDSDISPERLYEMSILVVCDNQETAEFIDREFSHSLEATKPSVSINKILISKVTVDVIDNITLRQLSGMIAFNDWDDLSSLPERLAAIRERPISR